MLIDGEHYPSVVADALRELGDRYDIRGAAFMGGTEKLRAAACRRWRDRRRRRRWDGEDATYGVAVVTGPDPVAAMCAGHRPVPARGGR